MREAEVEKVGAALSSVPTRAGQTVAVAAAAVSFITSTAVLGDLGWFVRLVRPLQITVVICVGLQIILVVSALVLTLTFVPPDTIGLYQAPSRVETLARRARLWEFWRWGRPVIRTQEIASPVGFAAEAQSQLEQTSGGAEINDATVDEYMAMIAFYRASDDGALLRRRRRRVATAASCVVAAAILGGSILFAATGQRMVEILGGPDGPSLESGGNSSRGTDVILRARSPNVHPRTPRNQ